MAINADEVQNVTNTDNPQEVNSITGASDASLFQESAGAETLNQKRELQVVNTGQPVTARKVTNNTTAAIVFVIIASIVLLMIASSVFRWVMKRPEPTAEEKLADEAEKKPKPEFIRPQKKLSRSKRRK